MNGKPAIPEEVATPEKVTEHATSLASDLIQLAELQAQLFRVDASEAVRKSAWSIVAVAMLTAVTVGSVPVLLIGASELLVEYLSWARSWTYLTVGLLAAIISVLIGAWAALRIQKTSTVFMRSVKEFRANLEFIKSLLQSRSEPRDRRPARF